MNNTKLNDMPKLKLPIECVVAVIQDNTPTLLKHMFLADIDSFEVEHDCSLKLRIETVDKKLSVTGAVDGWGNSCYDDYKHADVRIFIPF